MPFSPGGSPTDNKQTLNLQYNNPSRLHANNSPDSNLPSQMSGFHITTPQRYGVKSVHVN